MKKTTNGFPNLTWAEFRKQLDVIVTAMTANTFFPTLQTQVTALGVQADAYYVLDTKAESRDKGVLIARRTARIEVTIALHQLGMAVSTVCKGNEEMLSSSGFPFTKTAQKTSPLEKPNPPKLTLGVNSGVINVKTRKQKGSVSYNYYIAPADGTGNTELSAEAAWKVQSWNSAKFGFTDLIAGQKYFVKVGLVGVRGQEVISEPISYIPQ